MERQLNKFAVLIKVRRDLPMYTLRGYKLRGLFFGQGNIPVERQEVDLPDAAPGSETSLELAFTQVRSATTRPDRRSAPNLFLGILLGLETLARSRLLAGKSPPMVSCRYEKKLPWQTVIK